MDANGPFAQRRPIGNPRMPIEVRLISVNQFRELMGIEDGKRLIGIRDNKLRMKGEIALLLEDQEPETAHER